MAATELNPSLQEDKADKLKKPSLDWAIAISIVIFFLFLTFPIGSFFFIPKFKMIFADRLGDGQTLPAFTLFILHVSDAFRNNLIITVPVYFLFSLICAGFIGFNRFFLSRKISTIITVMFILFLCLVLIIVPLIAMCLPFFWLPKASW
jgi:hypothetical protein